MTMPAIAQNREFNLKFTQHSDILHVTYMGNDMELNNLNYVMRNEKPNVISGIVHIALVSNIRTGDRNNPLAINKASINASVVRAYLKVRYGLSDHHFTLHFDDGLNMDNNVKVSVEYRPIEVGENRSIYYTKSIDWRSYDLIMSRYVVIPMVKGSRVADSRMVDNRESDYRYADASRREDPARGVKTEPLRVESVKNEVETKIVEPPVRVETKIVEPPKEETKAAEPAKTDTRTVITVPSSKANDRVVYIETENRSKRDRESIERIGYTPSFAIKTNAAYWAGYTPFSYAGLFDMEAFPAELGNMLPNIEAEYYFKNRRFSLTGEALFGITNYSDNHWWKMSSYSVEPRLWLDKSGTFKGLYTGLFGFIGDYDIREELDVHSYGYTGMHFGGGLSLGYLQPVYKGFALELGLRGGYQSVNRDIYSYANETYTFLSSDSVSGFRLLGAKLSLMYRFQRK